MRDDVRRDAGLSSGDTDDDVRFRALVADALDQMLRDLGEDALLDALRDRDSLRLDRLTFGAEGAPPARVANDWRQVPCRPVAVRAALSAGTRRARSP